MATSSYCALRALTLCDGQRLETEPDRFSVCPHQILSNDTLWEIHGQAEQLLSDKLSRIQPSLPF